MAGKRGNGGAMMSSAHCLLMANLVATITDQAARQAAADHFATELRKRYPNTFDTALWERKTGGKVQGYDIHTGKFK